MKKAYISCPVSVSESHLQNIATYVNKCKWDHRYWQRGSFVYDEDSYIDHCDAFILVLPGNKFQFEVDKLPSGCRRELKRAMDARRKVFIAYEGQAGIHIYSTTISQMISGMAGSTGDFEKLGQSVVKGVDFTLGNKPFTLNGNVANSLAGCTAQLTNYAIFQGSQNQPSMHSCGTADYTHVINAYANPFAPAWAHMQKIPRFILDYEESLSAKTKADMEELDKKFEAEWLWGKPKVDRRAALFVH